MENRKSTLENEPEEKNPEQRVIDSAITKLEDKDAKDPIISSSWTESIKSFWKDESSVAISPDRAKTIGKIAGDADRIALFLSYSVLCAVYKFTKKAIQKKGQISYGEGYEIGQEIFSFDDKKEKK